MTEKPCFGLWSGFGLGVCNFCPAEKECIAQTTKNNKEHPETANWLSSSNDSSRNTEQKK